MPRSTQDIEEPKGLFALFKGESGTGKSVAALDFPTPYVLDFDRKLPGIALKHYPDKAVFFDHPQDMFHASELIVGLDSYCPYETVILDTITSLTHAVFSSVADVKGEPTPTLLKNLKGSKNKTIEMMGFDYYNAETRFVKWVLDELKALWAKPGNPRHVIIIAHVLAYKTEDIKTKLVTEHRSIVTGGKSIAPYIPAQFDDAYHFYRSRPDIGSGATVNGVAVITESMDNDNAKCSIKGFPQQIDISKRGLYHVMQSYGFDSLPAYMQSSS